MEKRFLWLERNLTTEVIILLIDKKAKELDSHNLCIIVQIRRTVKDMRHRFCLKNFSTLYGWKYKSMKRISDERFRMGTNVLLGGGDWDGFEENRVWGSVTFELNWIKWFVIMFSGYYIYLCKENCGNFNESCGLERYVSTNMQACRLISYDIQVW